MVVGSFLLFLLLHHTKSWALLVTWVKEQLILWLTRKHYRFLTWLDFEVEAWWSSEVQQVPYRCHSCCIPTFLFPICFWCSHTLQHCSQNHQDSCFAFYNSSCHHIHRSHRWNLIHPRHHLICLLWAFSSFCFIPWWIVWIHEVMHKAGLFYILSFRVNQLI